MGIYKESELPALIKKAESGDAETQFDLGMHYGDDLMGEIPDYEKAFHWFNKAANQGYVEAFYYVGDYYINGLGVKKDLKKGIEWLQKGADLHNDSCEFGMGECYEYGKGVKKNLKEAFKWYLRVANNPKSDLNDWHHIGIWYAMGIGTKKDMKKAYYWFGKMADEMNMNVETLIKPYLDDEVGQKNE